MTGSIFQRNLRIARNGIFIALFLGLGMIFVYVPNVEFIMFMTVLSARVFSYGRGLFVVISGESLFAILNPMGSSLAYPWLFAAQLLSLFLIVTVVGLLKPAIAIFEGRKSFPWALAALGILVTVIYDTLTGLSFPLASGFNTAQILTSWLAGVPFYGIHIFSNALIFIFILSPTLDYIRVHYPDLGREGAASMSAEETEPVA